MGLAGCVPSKNQEKKPHNLHPKERGVVAAAAAAAAADCSKKQALEASRDYWHLLFRA